MTSPRVAGASASAPTPSGAPTAPPTGPLTLRGVAADGSGDASVQKSGAGTHTSGMQIVGEEEEEETVAASTDAGGVGSSWELQEAEESDDDGPPGWDATINQDYEALQKEFCDDWRRQKGTACPHPTPVNDAHMYLLHGHLACGKRSGLSFVSRHRWRPCISYLLPFLAVSRSNAPGRWRWLVAGRSLQLPRPLPLLCLLVSLYPRPTVALLYPLLMTCSPALRAMLPLLQIRPAHNATRSVRKAVELDPGLLMGHNLLAKIYIGQGRFAKAVHHLKKALVIDPSMWEVCVGRRVGGAVLMNGEGWVRMPTL